MTADRKPTLSPDAALFLPRPRFEGDPPGPKLYFFKNRQFACWDVVEERLCDGYPRDIEEGWPGLATASGGSPLRGALHVPAWGEKVFFLFHGHQDLVVWDLAAWSLSTDRLPVAEVLPGVFPDGDFTPVVGELPGGEGVICAFKGSEYLRWRVGPAWPARLEPGFPRKIAADWKDGLVLAPRTGVYVEWPNRSAAHSNRKIYYFMGDLYLRWDVPSNTRNYRTDIASGWKGWPRFA